MLFRARLVGMLDIWPAFLHEITCSLSIKCFIFIIIGAVVVDVVCSVLMALSTHPMDGATLTKTQSSSVFQMLEYLHTPNEIFGSINLKMNLFMLHSHIYVKDLAFG